MRIYLLLCKIAFLAGSVLLQTARRSSPAGFTLQVWRFFHASIIAFTFGCTRRRASFRRTPTNIS